jgi:hypothetical protein
MLTKFDKAAGRRIEQNGQDDHYDTGCSDQYGGEPPRRTAEVRDDFRRRIALRLEDRHPSEVGRDRLQSRGREQHRQNVLLGGCPFLAGQSELGEGVRTLPHGFGRDQEHEQVGVGDISANHGVEVFASGKVVFVEEHVMALCLQGQSDFSGLRAVFRGIGKKNFHFSPAPPEMH